MHTNKILQYLAYTLLTFVITLLVIHYPLMFAARTVQTVDRYFFPTASASDLLVFMHRMPSRKITLPKAQKGPATASGDLDLDKLAKAVAMHETLDCKARAGSALVNNCFGIMSWDAKGRRYFRRFKTKEDSYKEFKRIWSTYYKKFPDYALAKKYSGNDRTSAWLANVTKHYHSL